MNEELQVRTLTLAREKIDRGWIRNQETRRVDDKLFGLFKIGEHYEHCMLGAIKSASREVAPAGRYLVLSEIVEELVHEEIPREPFRPGGRRTYKPGIAAWNDLYAKSKYDVMAIFDMAIRKILAGLDGPAKEIEVVPKEAPAFPPVQEPVPEPERAPAKPAEPVKVPAGV